MSSPLDCMHLCAGLKVLLAPALQRHEEDRGSNLATIARHAGAAEVVTAT